MSDRYELVKLDDWCLRLNQSINIDYLAILSSGGKVLAEAGSPGPIGQEDMREMLDHYFEQPENICPVGEFHQVRFIKRGAVECFVTPLDVGVQMVALTSIERPSVQARKLFTELNTVREEMEKMIKKEGRLAEGKAVYPDGKVTQDNGTHEEVTNTETEELEKLMNGSVGGPKKKEASKFWEGADLGEAELTNNGKTISYDEAKKSGLVPHDKS